MSFLSTGFNAFTVRFNSARRQMMTEQLLSDMPHIGAEPAIILGATRATAFAVQRAVEMGHRHFVVVGGQEVGKEDSIFTGLLTDKLKKAGLPFPEDKSVKERDYAAHILRDFFNIPSENITNFSDDNSSNTQQNFEVLKSHGFDVRDALDIYTLSGSARRVLATARRVWGNDGVLAVHNSYPYGITKDNWQNDPVASLFLTMEADKILSVDGQIPKYVRKGFCMPIDLPSEMERVKDHKIKMAVPESKPFTY